MSADLFVTRDVGAAARSRQSSLVLASIVAHAAAILAIVLVTILLPDVLPSPRAAALAWAAGPRLVRLTDIPLPPRPPTQKPVVSPPVASSSAAPLVAPTGISEEPPDFGASDASGDLSIQPGLVQGDVGGVTIVPPPPPPPAVAREPVRLHAGIDAPRKISGAAPAYPPLARAVAAQGVVIIEAVIDVNGDVASTKVLRSIALLDAAALDAVRQWKYTPARLNGEPVAVMITVTVNFTLTR
jgi:protein TonB